MVVPLEIVAIVITGTVGFWGWLAVKVIAQGAKLVELEGKVMSMGNNCSERLEWIRSMEKTLTRVAEDTMAIRTSLGETPHA